MIKSDKPFDWGKFWVHFVFGFGLGGTFGLRMAYIAAPEEWLLNHDGKLFFFSILIFGTLFGVLIGLAGDRFWTGRGTNL